MGEHDLPFVSDGDAIVWRMQPRERDLLVALLTGLDQTLSAADDADPAIDRLFPSAVSDDADVDAELRALMRDDLLAVKRAGVEALADIVVRAKGRRQPSVRLVDDEPELVLGVLNDLRLALGARITVELLDRDDLDENDPRWDTLHVMDWFGWLQEVLLEHLMAGDGDDVDDFGSELFDT